MRYWTPAKVRALKGVRKFATVTCYDATSAAIIESMGQDAIPLVLVGDSLGMTMQGSDTTLAVTVDEMVYHCRCVGSVLRTPLLLGDMPFGSYQVSDEEGVRNAFRIIREGGADAVKMEGGERCVPIIRKLVQAGVPVCGHLGLTPQSCLAMGGFRVQGRNPEAAERMIREAKMLEEAGCFALVAEGVPAALGKAVTDAVSIPVIGIGAGSETDAQILVWQDMLGLNTAFCPKFVRRFGHLGEAAANALRIYSSEVAAGTFPSEKESYS